MFVDDPTSWIKTLISLGPLAPAYLAAGVLWRALQASQKVNSDQHEESLKQLGAFSQIPVALDRFRVETLQGQKDLESEVRGMLQQCGKR